MSKTKLRFKMLFVTTMMMFIVNSCTSLGLSQYEIQQKLSDLEQREQALKLKEQAIKKEKNSLEQMERELSEQILEGKLPASQSKSSQTAKQASLLPPVANSGECYARVFVPPAYKKVTETLLKKVKSETFEIIPATYKTVEKKVLVSEAYEKKKTIPAKYATKTEKVLVKKGEFVWKTSLAKNAPKASDSLLATAKKHGVDLDAAHPGECFHEHYLPPVYQTEAKDDLVAEETYKIEIIPAKYKMVEEKILVSEASEQLVEVPPTYKWVEEKVLVKAAHTTWKKGRGLIESVDNTTGEIMCRVDVPAEYKTVRKKVIDKPASVKTKVIPAKYKTVKVKKMIAPASERKIPIPPKYRTVKLKKMIQPGQFIWHDAHNKDYTKATRTANQICLVEIPATYRTVKKRVEIKPAKTNSETIPAQYKTIKVKVVNTPAQKRRVVIPAEYQRVTKEVKVSDGAMEWRKVLCETNMSRDMVAKIQAALTAKGYKPGIADGILGKRTSAAITKYQQDNKMATGAFTYETLKSLGLEF